MEQPGDIIDIRKDKIRDLKQSGIDLYPNDFSVTHTVKDIQHAVVNQDIDCGSGNRRHKNSRPHHGHQSFRQISLYPI